MQPLEQITIAEYQATAEGFRIGTWDHDVSQNRNALISAMPNNPGRILDFGCGPGRDLMAFKTLGHEAIGLDATPAFVEMAKQITGCEVWQQNFLNLNLPNQYFDGVFANASLIHVPQASMENVLRDLYNCLVVGGAIVMSLARGTGEGFESRMTGDRYTSFWEYETMLPYLENAGFTIDHHYYRPPGLPKSQQSWVAIVAKRKAFGGM
jgi:SAM-dependent methyltransferase